MLPPTAMLPLMSSSMARLIGAVADEEVANLLLVAGVENLEVGLGQVLNDLAVIVPNGDGYRHDLDARLERRLGCLPSGRLCRFLPAETRTRQQEDQRTGERDVTHTHEVFHWPCHGLDRGIRMSYGDRRHGESGGKSSV